MRLASALTFALLLLGCSSGHSTSTATSGTGTSGSGSTSSSAGSTGIGSTGSGSGSSSGSSGCNTDQFSCALTEPCGMANYVDSTSTTGGSGAAPHFQDPAPARCILEHLRDRVASQLTVNENSSLDTGSVQTIRVLDATHASRDTLINQDVTSYRTDSSSLLIKPASFFNDCLDGGTDDTLWSCLNNWSDGTDNATLCCP